MAVSKIGYAGSGLARGPMTFRERIREQIAGIDYRLKYHRGTLEEEQALLREQIRLMSELGPDQFAD